VDARPAASAHHSAISLDCAVLLVSRFAGRASRRAVAHLVERLRLPDAAILEVGRDGSVRDITARLVADRVPLLLAAGGDGTGH
jgi:diacylglycerol kinase family enzyme